MCCFTSIFAVSSTHAPLLLPAGKEPGEFFVNGRKAAYRVSSVDASRYLDATLPADGCLDLEVLWK